MKKSMMAIVLLTLSAATVNAQEATRAVKTKKDMKNASPE